MTISAFSPPIWGLIFAVSVAVMLWLVSPAGLENFFKAIGRPRTAGAPAPGPFARPENVTAIERASGMTYTPPAAPER